MPPLSRVLLPLALLAALVAGCDGDDGHGPTPSPSAATPSPAATTSVPTTTETPAVSPTEPATATPESTVTPSPAATTTPSPTATSSPQAGEGAAELKTRLAAEIADPGSAFRRSVAPDVSGRVAGLADAPYYLLQAETDQALRNLHLRETIAYTNRAGQPLDRLYLRVFANAPYFRDGGDNVSIASLLVDGRPADWRLQETVLEISLPRPLSPDDAVRLDIELTQGIPILTGGDASLESPFGGDGNYGLYGFDGTTLILGHWYPAVVASGPEGPPLEFPPQGDVSFYEASFVTVSLTLPGDFEVSGSGIQTAERTDGGARTTEWAAAAVRDVAFLAGSDLASRESVEGDTTVRVAHRSDSPAEAIDIMEESAAIAVEAFEEQFGPYVYADLDVVEGPLQNGASGMEFSGLVVIDDDLLRGGPPEADLGELLDDPALEQLLGDLDLSGLLSSLAGLAPGSLIELVVAHEIAHQWWYAAVGSDPIRHPWMDEALTNYSAVLYFEERYGPERRDEAISLYLAGAYGTARLFGGADEPVDQPASAFDPVQYSGIVYGKGALFWHELRETLGDEAFFAGLRRYYERYLFDLAPNGAPVEELARSSGREGEVEALHRRWILETHGDEDIQSPTGLPALEGFEGLAELLEQLFRE